MCILLAVLCMLLRADKPQPSEDKPQSSKDRHQQKDRRQQKDKLQHQVRHHLMPQLLQLPQQQQGTRHFQGMHRQDMHL